jgi:hypothetical protein
VKVALRYASKTSPRQLIFAFRHHVLIEAGGGKLHDNQTTQRNLQPDRFIMSGALLLLQQLAGNTWIEFLKPDISIRMAHRFANLPPNYRDAYRLATLPLSFPRSQLPT